MDFYPKNKFCPYLKFFREFQKISLCSVMFSSFSFNMMGESFMEKNNSQVSGKNTSVGEMFQALTPQGIQILSGFIVTAEAFSELIAKSPTKEGSHP
jgi:hypothetical protein